MLDLLKDDRGDFIEKALWIIIFVLGLAPFVTRLTEAVGLKFEDFIDNVNDIGS